MSARGRLAHAKNTRFCNFWALWVLPMFLRNSSAANHPLEKRPIGSKSGYRLYYADDLLQSVERREAQCVFRHVLISPA